MSILSRAIRRPLAIAGLGGLVAALAVGGSIAVAAPASHHGRAVVNTHRQPTAAARHHHGAKGGSQNAKGGSQSGSGGKGVRISSIPWGSVGGKNVQLFTLRNSSGMKVKITNYGGVVQSIWVPRRNGGLTNVALGFPTLSDYVSDFTQGATSTPWPLAGGSGDTYFGAIIGRYANRIGGASFNLNKTTYKLDANNGVNTTCAASGPVRRTADATGEAANTAMLATASANTAYAITSAGTNTASALPSSSSSRRIGVVRTGSRVPC